MANHNQDMFSYLPECLLLMIISLLPFREAARTSILSRRWRDMWYSTPNIEFNEKFFLTQGENSNGETQRRAFLDFARQWIHRYSGGSVIESFRLVFSNPHNHLEDIDYLLNFACHNQVKFLDLDFSDPQSQAASLCNLQVFMHGFERLEYLKFLSCGIQFPKSQLFHALKNLYFGWIMVTETSIMSFLSRCPSLENLYMEDCWFFTDLEIIGSNLTTLVIKKCVTLRNRIKIDAPKLHIFKYFGPTVTDFKIENPKSLVEVDLDFRLDYKFRGTRNALYNLLNQICHVKVLTVCSYMLQVIPSVAEPQILEPLLNGVRQLTLHTVLYKKEFLGISFFLSNCPNLEHLVIDLGTPSIFAEARRPRAMENQFTLTSPYVLVCECIRKTLKVVEVKGFMGREMELLVLRFLMKYGVVLETICINVSKDSGTVGEYLNRLIAEKLLSSQRASKGLCILIS